MGQRFPVGPLKVKIQYNMIYLTAIGLTHGGSSTHLHTNKQYIEHHTC
jgi:hypothetical protein